MRCNVFEFSLISFSLNKNFPILSSSFVSLYLSSTFSCLLSLQYNRKWTKSSSSLHTSHALLSFRTLAFNGRLLALAKNSIFDSFRLSYSLSLISFLHVLYIFKVYVYLLLIESQLIQVFDYLLTFPVFQLFFILIMP